MFLKLLVNEKKLIYNSQQIGESVWSVVWIVYKNTVPQEYFKGGHERCHMLMKCIRWL